MHSHPGMHCYASLCTQVHARDWENGHCVSSRRLTPRHTVLDCFRHIPLLSCGKRVSADFSTLEYLPCLQPLEMCQTDSNTCSRSPSAGCVLKWSTICHWRHMVQRLYQFSPQAQCSNNIYVHVLPLHTEFQFTSLSGL